MKQQNNLELRTGRRDFTVGALLAMLGGVSITISACGGKAGSSPSSPSAPSTPEPVTDKAGVISNNHGHVAVITGAQLTAASTLALSIQGTASHNHMVELSGDEHPVQLGRDALHLVHLVVDAVEDRRHVHVRDAAEADHHIASNAACAVARFG